MSQALSPPVSISSDAAARLAELGFQHFAEDLLAQALSLLPGLQSVQLVLVPSYEMDDIPWLVLECHGERSEQEARDAVIAWYTWRADHLPFDVGRQFLLNWIHDEAANAG
jgi:hypothetical protein